MGNQAKFQIVENRLHKGNVNSLENKEAVFSELSVLQTGTTQSNPNKHQNDERNDVIKHTILLKKCEGYPYKMGVMNDDRLDIVDSERNICSVGHRYWSESEVCKLRMTYCFLLRLRPVMNDIFKDELQYVFKFLADKNSTLALGNLKDKYNSSGMQVLIAEDYFEDLFFEMIEDKGYTEDYYYKNIDSLLSDYIDFVSPKFPEVLTDLTK